MKGLYLGDLAKNPQRVGGFSMQTIRTVTRIGFLLRRAPGARAPDVGTEVGCYIDGKLYLGPIVESWAAKRVTSEGEIPVSEVTFEHTEGGGASS